MTCIHTCLPACLPLHTLSEHLFVNFVVTGLSIPIPFLSQNLESLHHLSIAIKLMQYVFFFLFPSLTRCLGLGLGFLFPIRDIGISNSIGWMIVILIQAHSKVKISSKSNFFLIMSFLMIGHLLHSLSSFRGKINRRGWKKRVVD